MLQKTPFGFDISFWEFFWPLTTGARLALAAPGDHRDPRRLAELIARHQVSTIHFVPSMLQAFMAHPAAATCQGLQRIICSGEALSAELQAAVLQAFPGTRLLNLYGPTEAAIEVTWWDCRDEGALSVPIGRPWPGCAPMCWMPRSTRCRAAWPASCIWAVWAWRAATGGGLA